MKQEKCKRKKERGQEEEKKKIKKDGRYTSNATELSSAQYSLIIPKKQ